MPHGVHMDVAPSGATRFVIVSLVVPEEEYQFGGVAFENNLYLVEARERSNSAVNVKAAAARIHELLQNQPLVVAGFDHMLTRREERVRNTEVDSVDQDVRW